MTGCTSVLKRIWNNITVEPSVLLFIIAFGMDSVPTNALWVHKICTIKMNLSEEICSNYTGTQYENEIQKTASSFTAYSNYMYQFPSAIFTAFVGAWSDKYGRRFALLFSPIGYALFYAGCMICVHLDCGPKLFLLPFVFIGSFGGMISLIIAALSYITDISTIENRTIRLAIVEACLFIAATVGSVLSSVLLKKYGFYATYGVAIGFAALSFTYTFFFVKESKEVKKAKLCKKVIDFFNWRNLKDSIKTTFRKREHNARLKVVAAVLCCSTYVLYFAGENIINFLFTNHKFHWDASTFGYYNAFFVCATGISLLISLPILTKLLKLNDIALGMLGAISRGANAIVNIFATQGWMMYMGTALTLFSGGVTLPIRAIASKAVPLDEVGKIFAVLGFIECLMPLLSSTIYTAVFRATISTFPSAVFVLTACLCFFTFCIFLIIFIVDRREAISSPEYCKQISGSDVQNILSNSSTDSKEDDLIINCDNDGVKV